MTTDGPRPDPHTPPNQPPSAPNFGAGGNQPNQPGPYQPGHSAPQPGQYQQPGQNAGQQPGHSAPQPGQYQQPGAYQGGQSAPQQGGYQGPGGPGGYQGPGGPGVGGPGGPSGPGGQNFAPQKKKSYKGLIIGLSAAFVVIVLVVVGLVVVNRVNKTQHGPDTVAQEYLDALAAGKIDDANKLAKPTVPEGASDAILKTEVASKSSDKITDAKVVSTRREGDNATVRVGFKVGDLPQQLELKAKKVGKEGLFFDKWQLEGPELDSIQVDAPGITEVTVNGVAVPLQDGKATLAAYPGTYEVAVPDSKFFTGSKDSATVGLATGTPFPIYLTTEANDDLTAEVEKQVKAKIDECIGKKEFNPDGCPFNEREEGNDGEKLDSKTISRKISGTPTVSVSASSASDISFYGTGRYDMTAKSEDGKRSYKSSIPFFMSFTGTAKVDGEQVSITFS
ncbi:hypothetical protein LWF01_11670 [Saxibacter everestensis]|uniref:Uncharacterized protein n=1 Tax=Saxibacter everestensis TaxID=2909229 RepID=A0ABY8QPB0_9MICO|nr:hypothetical protein LWF01_11670 [Brevibacteriaceae bacterium ZFBP1038]